MLDRNIEPRDVASQMSHPPGTSQRLIFLTATFRIIYGSMRDLKNERGKEAHAIDGIR